MRRDSPKWRKANEDFEERKVRLTQTASLYVHGVTVNPPVGRESATSIKAVEHRFIVTATVLNYDYELFSLRHRVVDYYPLFIEGFQDDDIEVASEDEFLLTLGQIFASATCQRVIGLMLAQTEEATTEQALA